jgi:cancer susceptibility candidate protein 1
VEPGEDNSITVGVWDENEKIWSTEEISDFKLDNVSRILEFTTKRLAQMALLQSRCTDYPYKRWKLRCTENQKAMMDIETRRGLMLTFEIGPEYLMFVVEEEAEGGERFP